MDLIMRLALLLIGFIIAMIGLIVAVHADFIIGILMAFGGCYMTIQMLPTFRRTHDN
jgi:hypothetical protein